MRTGTAGVVLSATLNLITAFRAIWGVCKYYCFRTPPFYTISLLIFNFPSLSLLKLLFSGNISLMRFNLALSFLFFLSLLL